MLNSSRSQFNREEIYGTYIPIDVLTTFLVLFLNVKCHVIFYKKSSINFYKIFKHLRYKTSWYWRNI